MAINNEPTIQPRTVTGIFTNYIAKVLPLAFDESMSYYECLCALLNYINNTIVPDINNTNDGLRELQEFYEELQSYVNNYFDNLDVQEEINNKLDQMVEDGSLTNLINNYFSDITDLVVTTEQSIRNDMNSQYTQLNNEINSVSSGSPAGVYATVSALTTADPDHSKIYLVNADGKWYYYDTSNSIWSAGGTYLVSGVTSGSIGNLETNTSISKNVQYSKTAFALNYDKFVVNEFESGYITPSNGNDQVAADCVRNSKFHTLATQQIKFISNNSLLRARYFCYNNDGTYDVDNSATGWMGINDTFTPIANRKYRLVIGTNNATSFNMNYLDQCGFFYTADYIENNLDNLKTLATNNDNNYNINYKSMPFSANGIKNVYDSKKLSNYERGSITQSNGNNWDGYDNFMRNKSAIEIKDCVIINLNPTKYRFRLIYYNAIGGYDNTTYVGSTGWYQQLVTKLQNENRSQRSKYSRLVVQNMSGTNIDMKEVLNTILIINNEDRINFKKPFIDIMAHQGGIGLDEAIPSNTLNAFSTCAKYDFTGFETDIRKTSDDVFIISHDVERTTTGGVTINVNESTYTTIESLQFYNDASIKIPTLDETLKNAKLNGMKLDIELKDSFTQDEINSICKLVKNNSMEDHVVFSSFSTDNLLRVRNVFDDVKVIIGMNSIIDPDDIETLNDYTNFRTLRSQGKTLLSLSTDIMSGHTSDVEDYIDNGFGIRVCYYGTDVTALTNYLDYADTILLNTEDLYSILYYFR